MKAFHVLIVDDDLITQRRLKSELTAANFHVSVASDGSQVSPILSSTEVDAVILDVNLPDQDGFSLMAKIRRNSTVPILMVSVRDNEDDRLRGLEQGADDYLVKPVSGREIVARLRNVLKRDKQSVNPTRPTDKYAVEDWVVDPFNRIIFGPDNTEIVITDRQFDLLLAFVHNPGRPLSRSWLHEAINKQEWSPTNRSIDILVSRLRIQLEENIPGARGYIKPVRNVGYRFTCDVTQIQGAL